MIDSNTVGGNLTYQDNTAATHGSTNVVSKNVQCQGSTLALFCGLVHVSSPLTESIDSAGGCSAFSDLKNG